MDPFPEFGTKELVKDIKFGSRTLKYSSALDGVGERRQGYSKPFRQEIFFKEEILSCGNKRKRFWITAIEIFIVEFKAVLKYATRRLIFLPFEGGILRIRG